MIAGMLRGLAIVLLLPPALLLVWLGFSHSAERADLVVACDELRTIDPQRVSWLDEIQTVQCLFEGLTRLDPDTQTPEPAAARAWDISTDGRRYTFHLDPQRRWSNGAPVLAEHFRYAWLRALRPETEAQYANLLFVIAGAEDFYRRDPQAGDPNSVALRAVDDWTLEVTLARPCPYFLEILALPIFTPLYPPALEHFADATGQIPSEKRHLWTRPGAIVGNGPFVLDAWEFKRALRLGRNPYYPAPERGVRTIEIMIVGNPNAALAAFETGRVDLVRTLEPDVARSLRARTPRPTEYHEGPRFATYFLRVNCRKPPLDQPAFRQALSLAINRRQLCENVLGLGETPAETLVPAQALHTTPAYVPPAGLAANLNDAQRIAGARDALRRSGVDPARLPALHLACANDPPQQRRINEALQRMWEETLGLRVELEVQERKVLSERIRNLDYALARSDWFGDYLDPGTFLDLFTSGSGQNRTGFADPAYDTAVAAATAAETPAGRYAAYANAERILCNEQLPIIPLFHRTGEFLLSPRIGGLSDNVRDILPLARARMR